MMFFIMYILMFLVSCLCQIIPTPVDLAIKTIPIGEDNGLLKGRMYMPIAWVLTVFQNLIGDRKLWRAPCQISYN